MANDVCSPIGRYRTAMVQSDRDASRKRNQADRPLASDLQAALASAREIADPWVRCQALTAVAERIENRADRNSVLLESLRAASELTEPNRILVVSAWPLRLLIKFQETRRVEIEIDRLLTVIAREPHPVRRCDALFWILKMLFPYSTWIPFSRLFDQFLQDCRAGHGWKRDRDLRDMAVLLTSVGDARRAEQCLDTIEKPRIRRQAVRMMDNPPATPSPKFS